MILDSKFPYFFWVNKEAEELILRKSIDDLTTEQVYKSTYVEGKLSNIIVICYINKQHT
jgi:hypothetical protein